jgi:hypothetical protein
MPNTQKYPASVATLSALCVVNSTLAINASGDCIRSEKFELSCAATSTRWTFPFEHPSESAAFPPGKKMGGWTNGIFPILPSCGIPAEIKV